mmetsp:Transcript_29317/g.42543  ORF Transcript_29317/g.42543 Transcript_29317/m.42543 type:complete len:357 (-) Transcript_29317:442-1512(-)
MLSSTTSPTNRPKSSSSTSPPKPTAPSSAPNISTGSTPSDASRLAIPSGNSTAENNYHYRRQTSRTTATPSTPSYNYNTTPSSSSTSYYNYNNHHHLSSHMSPQAYLTRLLDVQQMDIQSALDQMKTLCSTSPSRAYKTSYYRKQTKDHWARDDPAFFALQVVFLVCTSIAYVIAFRVEGRGFVSGVLDFLVKSVGVHYIGWGVIMATVGRLISNDYLTVVGGTGGGSSSAGIGGSGGREIHVKQKVEWLYAFDIHCNAFFPMFVLLYALQFFLLPFVLGKSLFAMVLANTLYGIAFSWYFYITHLGYRALPFLSNTEVFLFPIAVVVALYVLNLVGYPFGFGWNASRMMAYVFFD